MNIPLLSVIEWIQEDASYIQTFLFFLWGVWILWSFYKLPETRTLANQAAKYLSHINWLFIPVFLSLLSPLIARSIFESVFSGSTPLDLYKTVLPLITFLLGQMTARRQQEISKAETYEKIKYYISEEVRQNMTFVNVNEETANKELLCLNNGQIVTSPMFLLKAKSIELALIQVPDFLIRDEMLESLRGIQTLIELHNTAIEFRRQVVLGVRSTKDRATDYQSDLMALDDAIIISISQMKIELTKFLDKLECGIR